MGPTNPSLQINVSKLNEHFPLFRQSACKNCSKKKDQSKWLYLKMKSIYDSHKKYQCTSCVWHDPGNNVECKETCSLECDAIQPHR